MISKILVAVDGSECANRALDFALDIAEKFEAQVHIVNALEPPVYGSPDDPLAISAGMAGFIKDLRKSHGTLLAKAEERATAAKPSVKVTTELLEGNPPNRIVAAAAEGNFDIVVLGHGGEGRLRELFLGSVSERVAHLSKCAVLIVK